jgi:hypothetical protein
MVGSAPRLKDIKPSPAFAEFPSLITEVKSAAFLKVDIASPLGRSDFVL